MKELENIVSLVNAHGGFQTSYSRKYGLLYENLKLCLYTHRDQRNRWAKEWRAFLEKLGINSKRVSFLHHRFKQLITIESI